MNLLKAHKRKTELTKSHPEDSADPQPYQTTESSL